MPILITRSSGTIAQLADQLLTSRASDTQRAAAVLALEHANPALAGQVNAGTAIVLPDLPNTRARLDHVGTIAGTTRLQEVESLLTAVPDDIARRVIEVAGRKGDLVAANQVAADIVGDAQLKRFLTPTRTAAATDRADADAAAAAALAKAFAEAAPRWAEQLEALKSLLLRAG